ncbi:vWA domain-containing protein [Granulosicoccus sp. 3-233]|uniref:vWA domain-containing protein n=1 Tax=Granulosicoccus sp. 3-233 TaxID=3417969 RepID=UPI003D357990
MRSVADAESVAGRTDRLRWQRHQVEAETRRIHWPNTLKARRNARLLHEHLRFKAVRKSISELHCVLLDCSASMMTAGQLAAAKGVLLDLGQQAYRRRDALAVISFAGNKVQVLHDPHKAGAHARAWIEPISGGGGSPVHLAIQRAEQLMLHQQKRFPDRRRVLWLLSDGRYEPLPALPRHVHECHVVDFESGFLTLGRIRQLAELWQATYTPASHWVGVRDKQSPGNRTFR